MEQSTTYAGQRLGLPENGPGSVASWLSRLGALVIDWFACLGVATLVTGGGNWEAGRADWVTPLVFVIEAAVLTALAGGSFGKIVMRLAVVRVPSTGSGSTGPVNVLQGALRTLLICLVIPPLVFNRDNRGLHDLAVGTVVVRR